MVGLAFVVLGKDLFDLPHEHLVVLSEHLGILLDPAFHDIYVAKDFDPSLVHRLCVGLCNPCKEAVLIVGFDGGDVERFGFKFFVLLFELGVVADRRIDILGPMGRGGCLLAVNSMA